METKKKGEVFPLVKGYELVAEIGGGGFSVYVPSFQARFSFS